MTGSSTTDDIKIDFSAYKDWKITVPMVENKKGV